MADSADLLFELGTEELPPTALKRLMQSLEKGFLEGLSNAGLSHGECKAFATPRRLALLISDVQTAQEDRQVERRGPAVKAAFDADDNPTKAAAELVVRMNPDLDKLQPYPFEKLNALKAGASSTARPHIALSIGEPKHATPGLIAAALREHLDRGLASYPLTKGMPELRAAICDWLTQRFGLPPGSLDPERHALPVNGTREALFAFAQAVVERDRSALVISPNPFYQIYEGAALLAGAEPVYLNTLEESGYLPDLDAVSPRDWDRCAVLFLCSPGNPTGAVLSEAEIVRDKEQGGAVVGVHLEQQVDYRGAGSVVEIARGLVGEQDRGLHDESTGDGDTLLLPAG